MEFAITTTKNKIISGADELAKFLKSKDGNYRVIAMIENLSVTDWRNLIKNFQTYTFETLDIII